MASRPAWEGHLKLSLVTCPVTLHKAVNPAAKGVSFNLLNPGTGNRIRMKTTDPVAGDVARSDLVKGYAIDKGLYVTLTDDELRGLRLESNGAIQIERFVPEADIDRLYWDTPFYLVPDGTVAAEPYAVIREAMREAGQVALARVVMNGRERQFALEARGKGIIAHAIRTHLEVKSASEFFDQLPDREADANMVAIAKQILRQHEGVWHPEAFVDRYQEAVLALVKEKQKTHGVTRGTSPGGPEESMVLDLMEQLQRSLTGSAEPAQRRKRASKSATGEAPKSRAPRRKAG